MGKLKDGLIKKHDEEIAFKKEQEELRQKHRIKNKDDNKIIVEKKSTAKYLVLGAGSILQVIATVIILGLAMIGVTVLAHPTARQALLSIFSIYII